MGKIIGSLVPLFFFMGIIFVVIASFSSSGISERNTRNYQAALQRTTATLNNTTEQRNQVAAAIDSYGEILGTVGSEWKSQLAIADKHIASYQAAIQRGNDILEADDYKQERELQNVIAELTREANAAQTITSVLERKAKHVSTVAKNPDAAIEKMQGQVADITTTDVSDLHSRLTKAASDWPGKQQYVNEQLGYLKSIPDLAEKRLASAEAQRKNNEILGLVPSAGKINELANHYLALQTDLPKRIDELYVSWRSFFKT